MKPPTPPRATGDVAEFASAAALAGVARELEGLRKQVKPLAETTGRVDDLARLVSQLAGAVSALTARKTAAPAPSWLTLPDDPDAVRSVLDELTVWLGAVFLRYPDGVEALPECWLWHPDVVEELLWLMHAWCTAYQGAAAAVALAGDWHDRQRPGVVRRITRSAGTCSLERHQTRDGWGEIPSGPPEVPAVGAVEVIARWWAIHRDGPAPEPDASLAAAARPGGRDGFR